jgi:hypothetical protein
MIAQFMDTAAGAAVYIDLRYVVTLRPAPTDPDHVSILTLRTSFTPAAPLASGTQAPDFTLHTTPD